MLIDKSKIHYLLRKHNCIINNYNIELSSGNTSRTYYDIKKAAGIPELFHLLIKSLKTIIPENSSIISVSTGGIPFGSVIAYDYKTSFAYVRDNEKKYGMKNLIEGTIDFSKPIYIIDDVCTTGKSILKVKKALNLKDNECNLVCIVNRNLNNLKILSILET